ncbi:MAG: hypothetical protein ACI4RS_02580, partial [Monoglobaceae bacterium]
IIVGQGLAPAELVRDNAHIVPLIKFKIILMNNCPRHHLLHLFDAHYIHIVSRSAVAPLSQKISIQISIFWEP